MTAIASLVAWSGLAGVAIVVLRASVIRPDGEAMAVAFELLRRMALAAAWYVLVLTIAGALARGVRALSLVRVLDALTVAPLRHTIRAALGAGLAGALALSSPALAAAGPDDPPIVTLHRLPPPTPTTVPATSPTTRAPAAQPPPAAPRQRAIAPQAPAAASEWRVQSGECFWTIAESVLAARLGRPVLEREIVPYWQQLIAANRSQLRDTANPDLILPGQTFVLPG